MAIQKGQITNPKGKPKGTHQKTLTKAEIAVRIEMLNLGYTDAMIAMHIGMTAGAYAMLKRTTAYKQIYSKHATGIVNNLSEDVETLYRQNRQILESSVPIALQNLAHLASQKLDKKLQLEASKEILDRHGKFGKVSRMGLATAEQGGFADPKDNAVAQELFDNLTLAASPKAANKEETVN